MWAVVMMIWPDGKGAAVPLGLSTATIAFFLPHLDGLGNLLAHPSG